MLRAAFLAPAVACLAMACAVPAARAERPAPAPPDPGQLCRPAIQAAEREHKVPTGLLHAIGKVESGRPDASGRNVAAWPWTINAEGQGRYFATKAEAIAAVEALRARGVTVIDVGCLQVNLKYHPDAFPDLAAAFDPLANARYAGGFLRRLQAQAGSWEKAAANYHSATPERGEPYRQQVMAAWPAMAVRLAEEQRREAMIAAWADGKVVSSKPIGTNGFQIVAMATQGSPRRGAGQPLLMMGTPVLRPSAAGRRGLLEVAEAPPLAARR
ncbi:lytic transglycosylase domain-containing protein [Dankookia sp. GCM10030260]|uniref:lytic transglycosylase domain-containing protein n=1 Tax=Dankookia sp. GCM10030260 TaxID=3273390 RepID=UPI003617DBCA